MLVRVLRRLRTVLTGRGAEGLALLAVAIALEALGRGTPDDGSDLALVFGLLLLVGVGAALELRLLTSAVEAVKAAWAAMRAGFVERFHVKVGVDLRGTPPLARRALPHHRVFVPLLTTWALAAGAAAWLPLDLRATVTRVAYLPWFVLLLATWTLVLGAAAVLVFAASAWLHDRFVIRGSGVPRPRQRLEVLAIGALFVVLGAPGVLLPTWCALAGALAAFVFLVAVIAGTRCFDLALAWRHPRATTLCGTTWHATVLREVALILLAWLALVLTADGRRLLALPPDGGTFVTGVLGAALAWIGGLVLAASCTIAAVWLLRHRRADPSRPLPPQAHLAGAASDCERAARVLRAAGFSVRRGAEPRVDDVRLEIVPEPMPPLPRDGPRWPLRVSPTALGAPELVARLVRRDEIQRRRRLLRGIESAFKAAARRTYRQGTGFWLAPHWWFVPALSRDTSEEEWDPDEAPLLSDALAPSWHVLIGRAGRAHAYALLRTLEVDFILVEDGVGFRGLRRVLRALFEHYDVQHRRIEGRHLGGLPGLRCLLHDVTCGEPWTQTHYPEPDYDDISRARILHVFRDRGGEEAEDSIPPERVDVPDRMPAGLGV